MIRLIDRSGFTMFYMKQPVKRWTFEQPKLKLWQEQRIIEAYEHFRTMVDSGLEDDRQFMVLNAFAGKVRLNLPEGITVIRVDMNDEFKPDFNMEIFEYITTAKELGFIFDYIMLDPPYNLRKSREKYNGRYIGSYTKIKNELIHILRDGGFISSYGYDTTGLSESRGFLKTEAGMVCHSGDHNDTLVVEEMLTNRTKGIKYCEKKAIYNDRE